MSNNKEIINQEQNKFLIPNNEETMSNEELEGLVVSFDRIKIPSGGTTVFEIPSADDPERPDAAREIEAIILDHYPVNAFYQGKYDGTQNKPNCSSNNGRTGINEDGEMKDCATCEKNIFGSGEDGISKACKNMHKLYLLRNGDIFPLILTLPPTSVKPFSDYIVKRLVGHKLRCYEVVTRIGLKKAESTGGITYVQATFAIANILPDQQRNEIKTFVEQLKPILRNTKTEADDALPF